MNSISAATSSAPIVNDVSNTPLQLRLPLADAVKCALNHLNSQTTKDVLRRHSWSLVNYLNISKHIVHEHMQVRCVILAAFRPAAPDDSNCLDQWAEELTTLLQQR